MEQLKKTLGHPFSLFILVALLTLWLGRLDQNRTFLAHQLVTVALDGTKEEITKAAPTYFVSHLENEKGKKVWEELFFKEVSKVVPVKRWEQMGLSTVNPDYPKKPFVMVKFISHGHFVTVHVLGSHGKGEGKLWLDKKFKRFYATWLSLVPILLCLWLVVWRKKVFSALVLAIVTGCLIFVEFDLYSAFRFLLVDVLYNGVMDAFHFQIIAFTFCLLWIAQLSFINGGTAGLVQAMVKYAKNRYSSQLVAFFMGFFIFFDDYANSILVGTSMRGLFDKFKISRAKLAYIVDSTAAPVAALAVVSTWVGYEIGLLQDVLSTIKVDMTGFQLFFKMIPYRFYCIISLFTVFLSVLLKRDFKNMIEAGKVLETSETQSDQMTLPPGIKPQMGRIVFPLGFLLIGAATTMILQGWMTVSKKEVHQLGEFFPQVAAFFTPFSFQSFIEMIKSFGDWFSNSSSTFILAVFAALAALLSMMTSFAAKMKMDQFKTATKKTISTYMQPLGILVCAWCINIICKELQVADFFLSVTPSDVNARIIPFLTFTVAGVIAFSTGTSWGTMAILIPAILPLSYNLGGVELLIICAASILDGAVFGDHISPISDTTILSSVGAGCDHLTHVKTQLNYAFVAFTAALTFGYFLVPHDVPFLVSYFLSICFLVFVLMIFGHREVEEAK